MLGCTTTYQADGSWQNTLGKARVTTTVCEQMVYPEGTNKPDADAIGFGCTTTKHESDGMSGEFASVIAAIINIVPGLPGLTAWVNKVL
jgi:hypothetical protein